LTRRHRHSSEAVWRARLEAGELRLGDALAAPLDLLRAGQVLVWRRPPWEEPAVPLAFAVLHLDEHLLAVAKPRGLPSIPAGGFLTHTLLHLVRLRWPEATPLHRLGRGTSGLLLFARTPGARRALSADWRAGRVGKSYRALVSGVPARVEFSIDTPIGLVPHPRLGQVHAAAPDGRPALSHVRVLAARGASALVEVHIPTGRPHQIRIHMAAAGHPLVGDPLYAPGGLPLADPGLPGDGGYRLHAWRLDLEHPATGARLELQCAAPPELRG
jgi:23S rRNA pseudouridine1911/1915/1917 synthase